MEINLAHLCAKRAIASRSDSKRRMIVLELGGRHRLGLRRYADEYAEIGHAPQ